MEVTVSLAYLDKNSTQEGYNTYGLYIVKATDTIDPEGYVRFDIPITISGHCLSGQIT